MKKTILFILLLTFAIGLGQTTKNEQKHLLGKIKINDLKQTPFNNWFQKEYTAYKVHKTLVKDFKSDLEDYEIKVFLGTWCGDSKREVPRFLKILDNANFPSNHLEIICLNKTDKAYKQSPNHEEKGLNIHRVPTFIFYKGGKEINRIVEHPVTSFERDMRAILGGSKYRDSYSVVSRLEQLINEKGLDKVKEMEAQLLPMIAEFTKGSRELNTYGYVNLRAGHVDKALFIFNLNAKVYPLIANVYDSLGETYYQIKDYPMAKECYEKALQINKENLNAKQMLATIYNKLAKTL